MVHQVKGETGPGLLLLWPLATPSLPPSSTLRLIFIPEMKVFTSGMLWWGRQDVKWDNEGKRPTSVTGPTCLIKHNLSPEELFDLKQLL